MTDPLEIFLEALGRGEEFAEQAAQDFARLPVSERLAALEALADLMADPQPDQRWWAVRLLNEVPHEAVLPLLLIALQDPDASVRQCAALSLRQRPTSSAVLPLIAALHDADLLTAQLAGQALAAIGPPAVEPLIACLPGLLSSRRLLGMRALAELSDSRAIPALFAALEDDSLLVGYWANEGLERLGMGMAFFAP